MEGIHVAGKPSGKVAGTFLAIGLIISASFGVLENRQISPMTTVDHLFLDNFLRYSVSGKAARNTVVVDIDDVSLSAVGQWPWPRYRTASLIQSIARARPSAIALDMLFSEPDRSSLANIKQTFKRDFGLDISFTGAPEGLMQNDGFLGEVFAQTGAVGSTYFYFDHVSKPAAPVAPGLRIDGRTDLLTLNNASGILLNTPEIASQTSVSGFINYQRDDDGLLRRLPLLMKYDGVIHASLALATVMRSLGTDAAVIEAGSSGPVIRVRNHRIPIDASGFSLLRSNGGARLYPSVLALDILNGSFRPEDIAGKIVFVGSTAAGLNDLQSTAFGPQFPGLKVHAVMAEGIIDDALVSEPTWASTSIFVACMIAGVVMAALFIGAGGAGVALLGTTLLAALLGAISMVLFLQAGEFVSPGAPILVAGSLFAIFSLIRFAIERRRAYVWLKRLEHSRQIAMEAMAAVAETRDPETGAHIKRTQHYVKAIAEQLAGSGKFADILTAEYIYLLFISAPLHDIGKVGIPDHILLKPGKLTAEEFVIMKRHAELGQQIILNAGRRIEGDNFLVIGAEIAGTHHERWDGTGYPLGLAGAAIPLSGRIMAVADIYDALISRRCYKEPFPHAKATGMMRSYAGTTFDPVVLDAFFAIEGRIQEIAAQFRDEDVVTGIGSAAEVSSPDPGRIVRSTQEVPPQPDLQANEAAR